MTFTDLLAFKHLTVAELSRKSSVPYSTLNDIYNGKYFLEDCSGKILLKLSKALNKSVDFLLSLDKEEAYKGFPEFLEKSIKEYLKAIRDNKKDFDIYSMELNSNINICEVENIISHEHANKLRKRFF